MRGLSLVAASGGHSSSRCAGLSLSRPLLLRSTSSSCTGSVVVAHGPSCSAACGILPDQGLNPCPLHWQADSQPLCHQGSPAPVLFKCLITFWTHYIYIFAQQPPPTTTNPIHTAWLWPAKPHGYCRFFSVLIIFVFFSTSLDICTWFLSNAFILWLFLRYWNCSEFFCFQRWHSPWTSYQPPWFLPTSMVGENCTVLKAPKGKGLLPSYSPLHIFRD